MIYNLGQRGRRPPLQNLRRSFRPKCYGNNANSYLKRGSSHAGWCHHRHGLSLPSHGTRTQSELGITVRKGRIQDRCLAHRRKITSAFWCLRDGTCWRIIVADDQTQFHIGISWVVESKYLFFFHGNVFHIILHFNLLRFVHFCCNGDGWMRCISTIDDMVFTEGDC